MLFYQMMWYIVGYKICACTYLDLNRSESKKLILLCDSLSITSKRLDHIKEYLVNTNDLVLSCTVLYYSITSL
jgi:hypothetical protein